MSDQVDQQDQNPLHADEQARQDAQAAQNAARNENNPNPTGEDLNLLVGRLQGETLAQQERIASLERGQYPPVPKLPDPRTVSDAFYIENAAQYRKQYGIRKPKFGGWS